MGTNPRTERRQPYTNSEKAGPGTNYPLHATITRFALVSSGVLISRPGSGDELAIRSGRSMRTAAMTHDLHAQCLEFRNAGVVALKFLLCRQSIKWLRCLERMRRLRFDTGGLSAHDGLYARTSGERRA